MITVDDPWILASASARRRKLLSDMGLCFDVIVPMVEEVFRADDPGWTVRENARRKNAWCVARHPARRILTADTVVVFEGRCVTKPCSLAEAVSFLLSFSGREQSILTGVALYRPGQPMMEDVVASRVIFKPLDRETVSAYLSRVDPMDKAGGYDIDQHGGMIIQSFSGSYSNIMGLPVEVIRGWLTEDGA